MTNPKISVVMPVYNAEKYLREAIDSILSQSFTDFEFLIINDGSTDNSEKIILSYYDERIRYIKNETNLKLCKTLNKGFQLSKGQYIARMDSDDIAVFSRFQEQVDFLESHPEVGFCGSFVEVFGDIDMVWEYPISSEEIRCNMLFSSPFCHPTMILRKSILQKYNLKFDSKYEYCEDYDLWIRASLTTKMYNIPKILLYYRKHSTQITTARTNEYQDKVSELRAVQLQLLGITPDAFFLETLDNFVKSKYPKTTENLLKTEKVLYQLKSMNQKLLIYDRKTFDEMLFWRCWIPMLRFFRKKVKKRAFLLRFLAFSPFSHYYLRSRTIKYLGIKKNEN